MGTYLYALCQSLIGGESQTCIVPLIFAGIKPFAWGPVEPAEEAIITRQAVRVYVKSHLRSTEESRGRERSRSIRGKEMR